MNRIRALFFDFGKTLSDPKSEGLAGAHAYLQKRGFEVSGEDVKRGIALAEKYNAQMRTRFGLNLPIGERVWFNHCRLVVEGALGIGDGSEIAEAMWWTDFHDNTLYPDTLSTLKRLKADGYLLGIISNWEAPTLHDLCRSMGISDYIDVIVPSRDAESAKPDSGIFHTAMDALGVSASESVHVGDSFGCDVEGALKVGITPVYLAREEPPPDDYDGHVIHELSEIFSSVR